MHRFNKIICAMIKNGYTKVRNGCAMIKTGYTKVKNGCTKVKNGCAKVKNGCAKVKNGCAKVKNGCTKVKNGCTKVKNGCTKVKNGYFSLFLLNYIIIKLISEADLDEPYFGNYTSTNPTVNRRVDAYRELLPFPSSLGNFEYSS